MEKGAAYWMDLRNFDCEDPIFLAKVQRGITNFVRILCGKSIPVEYALQGDSMTDGETVYITANLKEDTIDQIVGLALHEASHVLLTDFGYLNKEKGKILEVRYNVPKEDVENVFTLINFIEDKRIDHYVYSTAPGYQFYYEELYRKSFYNNVVDDNLQSDNFITPTWDAYFFRIINIFNRNSDLDKLSGLKEVFDLIDIKNINRLKSTRDSVDIAVGIYDIIKEYIDDSDEAKFNKTNAEYNIKHHVEKQKKFINNEYRKKRINKKQKDKVSQLASSKTNIKNIKVDTHTDLDVVVTKDWQEYFSGKFSNLDDAVSKGFTFGKVLLSKLSARNTVKKDIFENQKRGKIDRKKLFKAPFKEDIFYKIEKQDYKQTFLHISLDLSGSMRGDKLKKTIQTAVAIAYASCYLKNFDVEISLRGTITSKNEQPLLAYAFDSRVNKPNDLKKLSSVVTCGMTPEGICLDYIRKTLPKPSYYQEVYLLNISDGLPNIGSTHYNFSKAVNHTKSVVKSIKRGNVGVLSYYIHDTWDKTDKGQNSFRTMYGTNAKFIDVENVAVVAKTINNLLLSNTFMVS